MTKTLKGALLLSVLGTGAWAQDVTLTIESWRHDDLTIWQDEIIPAFEAEHPGIKLNFTPSAPAEYNAILNSKLDAGSAGDIITCRPFDASLALYEGGKLADLSDLEGMANFSDVAKSAWITDDGEHPFCVPMGAVIHGFIYNKEIFEELGLEEPTTVAEFYDVLNKIKEDGTYIPMALGTNSLNNSRPRGVWPTEEPGVVAMKGTSSKCEPTRKRHLVCIYISTAIVAKHSPSAPLDDGLIRHKLLLRFVR